MVPFDASAYLRIEAPHGLGSSASGASFATSTGDILEVSCFGPGVFRLRMGPHARPDYGVLAARAKACDVGGTAQEGMRFGSGDATLEITSAPLQMRLSHRGTLVLASITDQHFRGFTRMPAFGRVRPGGQWAAAFALASGEAVYGLGEKFGPLDKRGQLLRSDVADALGVNTGLAYKDVPFAWSPGAGAGAWGVFVHTPGRVTHGVGHPDWSHRSYGVVVEDEALDVFVMCADAPAGILERYTDLTGRAAPVPLWSLGLWLSRASCRTPEEATAIVARMRLRRLPCDVWAFDGRTTWNTQAQFDFEWDADRFHDPATALARIRANDVRICVWEYPYVSVHGPLFQELAARRYLLRTPAGDPYVFRWDTAPDTSPFGVVRTPLPESGIVDFTNPAAYAWWRDAHAPLFEAGVNAIACDMGEHVPDDAVAFNGDRGARLHNVYPLLYQRCVLEATAKFQPPDDAPPVIWARAGWSGSQRVPVHFGGEPQSDWEALAAAIRGALSWGMSGGAYYALDVGGFYGEPPTAELYVRWLQVAVFASHLRLYGIGEREPWAFGSEAEAIARKWLAFRYRLLPYVQSVIAEAQRTGLPVMRAMPLAFPSHPLVTHYETQFMCGDALLVVPVLKPGGEVEIAFPPGAWHDLNTRQRFAGPRVVRYRAALDQMPVFGREGFALPLGRAVQHTREIDTARPLESLWVFGAPTHPLEGYAQATVHRGGDGAFVVEASEGVRVERFGEQPTTGGHA